MKEYKFKINAKHYDVVVNKVDGKVASLTVNGVNYTVEMENNKPTGSPVERKRKAAHPVDGVPESGRKQRAARRQERRQERAEAAAPGFGMNVKSPLPGVIIDLCVKEGQSVKRGQKVAVLEAMKMENDILAEKDGTITSIKVQKGDSVLEGAIIATIG